MYTAKKWTNSELETLKIASDAIRGLSIDGVQAANSGHPGLPLGAADFATVLWANHLKHNPKNPHWKDRDRFVLSGGHGSMLIYSLLHLTGYDLSLDELRNFRQLGSKTPGHPEYGHTPGVETTTGPLGQGLANAVGFALAESSLAARYNQERKIIDHFTYVFLGDGDLQEGISHEACSLAGHLKLGKMVALYDDNDITIDGATSLSFSEDTLMRFESYGWHVQQVDGHDYQAIEDAIVSAKNATDKPSIISCKTIIGKGSPNKQGTSGVHGAPLGKEEKSLTKKELGLVDEDFHIEELALSFFRNAISEGEKKEKEWLDIYSSYKSNHPDLAKEFESLENVASMDISDFEMGTSLATRAASGKILNQLATQLPGLLGGSADLTPSNNTLPSEWDSYSPQNVTGRYIRFGVREHAMGAIMNGMVLHGGVIPYGGTFFVFTDYMRPAMRLSALMNQRVIYVLTHDSIGLGEDGPTHQPVAHLTSLRSMPNMTVIRPADANETAEAWKLALSNTNGPTSLVLTRQGLPVLDSDKTKEASKGGYILDEDTDAKIILIATGSEINLALEAKAQLNEDNIPVRVVSMPSTEIFDKQDVVYKDSILPPELKARVAVEAGASLGWHKYVGLDGGIVGLDTFGASAPYKELFEHFNITTEAVVNAAKQVLSK